jgi:uncharacterized integral membrane protein
MTFTIILSCIMIILLSLTIGALINNDQIMLTRIAGICMVPLGIVLILFAIIIAPFEFIWMKIRINKINKGE